MTDTPAAPHGADESALHDTSTAAAPPQPAARVEDGMLPSERDHEVVEGAEKRADSDTEEIEHDGAKYRIPAALKSAFMLQADYDTRTRELSEQRRTLESRAQAQEQRLQERAEARARLGALDLQLKSFETAWQNASQTAPAAAQSIWMRWQHLKEQRAGALSELQRKQAERTKDQSEERARGREAGRAVLARDIRDW